MAISISAAPFDKKHASLTDVSTPHVDADISDSITIGSSGTIDATAITSGTITGSNVVPSGAIQTDAVGPTQLDQTAAFNFSSASGTFVGIVSSTADVSDRALITGGTISSGTIPPLDATKITSGTMDVDRLGLPTIWAVDRIAFPKNRISTTSNTYDKIEYNDVVLDPADYNITGRSVYGRFVATLASSTAASGVRAVLYAGFNGSTIPKSEITASPSYADPANVIVRSGTFSFSSGLTGYNLGLQADTDGNTAYLDSAFIEVVLV